MSTQSSSNVSITGGSITGITDLAVADGGTGSSTAQGAINTLAGAVTSGSYLRGNGTNVVMNTIQAADVPTLNQSTTGSAATLTTGRTIAITGDLAYTSTSFNGSANVTAAGTLATVNTNVGSFTNATLTVNGKGLITAASSGTAPVTSVTATSPVASTGGTTPVISMPAATTTVSGYLTSTDWTTFNNKGSGTITSVTGTSPVVSSGGTTPAISLASGYGDTQNPYASKTANYFLAAPNGLAGAPTFRAIVAADIPTLNQNTTGTSANITGTVAIANGGTGQTTAGAAFNALSPITTTGDLILGNGANSATRLGIGTTGYVLTSNGTTASWAAASGGALSWQTVQTANFAASSGSAYPVNTTSGSKTVTLPASPSAGNSIAFVDYAGTWGTNGLVVNPNGNKLNGSGLNSTFGTNREGFILVYIDATQGWLAYAGFNTVNPTQSFNLDLLIVAGGGGGGADSTFGGGGWKGGAGGAGGYLEQSTRVVSAGAYTVTVGSGGVAGSSAGASGGTGNTSVFSTSTALGGGAGAGSAGNNTSAGNPGGSGGGGSGGLSGSSSGGSATQGNSGGATGYGFAGGGSGYAVAGGGGGAGGAGTGSVSSGGGGTGRTSAITSITYAAGGAVAGGVAGTANRGNGGSGGAGNGAVGYAGGSGVVVFKYTSSVTATYSGGVTRTTSTSGGFTTDTITATSTTSETVTFS
jgi:hypothetical protein